VRLDPYGTAFVVLRSGSGAPVQDLPQTGERHLAELQGPWTVRFPPDRGAPAEQAFPRLMSWSESGVNGIRYFSGTASYAKDFVVDAAWLGTRDRVMLDLGDVRDVADVVVNGTPVRTLWAPPYRTDVTRLLKAGNNRLEVRVTNLWVNRIIGDLQPGTDRKYAFTVVPVYKADSPLLPSGLLGPVSLIGVAEAVR
jgi:Glycosyl hydrolases family 2, sugar binding domain